MTTRKQDTSNFLQGTGRSWEDWLVFLDGIDAAKLTHTDIAARVKATGMMTGWWAQGITVAYEQHIGRRVPGQTSSGVFEVSVTKTMPGTMDDALDKWKRLMAGRTEIGGVALDGAAESSATEKWRYWRCKLDDGSRIAVTIGPKPPDRALLAVQHTKLTSTGDIERWRKVWKAEVEKL